MGKVMSSLSLCPQLKKKMRTVMPTSQGDENWDVNQLAHVWFRLKGLPLVFFPSSATSAY